MTALPLISVLSSHLEALVEIATIRGSVHMISPRIQLAMCPVMYIDFDDARVLDLLVSLWSIHASLQCKHTVALILWRTALAKSIALNYSMPAKHETYLPATSTL